MQNNTLTSIVSQLSRSANALSALAAAIDARLSGEPALHTEVQAVVDALAATDALEAASEIELRALLAEIRTFSLTNTKLLFAESRRAGWGHAEPLLLEAAGEVSAIVPHRLKSVIAPQLPGLAARLERSDAMFLDVGVGVASLSIEMARLWPRLGVVGIDPHLPALMRARERVRAAGLQQRIELREQRAEALSDERAFDLVWVPSLFLPEASVATIIERVVRALRPGGWLLFPCLRATADPLASALARLRTAMFGGYRGGIDQAAQLLAAHELESVHALPAPATALTGMVVGRRRA
jgi:2-polyprenyl-3-methyl-5-hydroxy-6-metoxy-1,4-benzoquinol methylase